MSQDPPTPPEGVQADEKGLKARLTEASLPSKIALGIGAFGALFFIGLVISLFIGLVLGESAAVADTVAVIRDLFIILLAMQGLLISLALVILVLQVAALLNLFQNEIKPILQDLQETAQTVKGTSAFVKENVTVPLIETQAWMAGVSTFITRLNPFRATPKAEADFKAAPETKGEATPPQAAKPEAEAMPDANAEVKAEAKSEPIPPTGAKPAAEAMPDADRQPPSEDKPQAEDKTETQAPANEDEMSRKVDDDPESTP